MKKHKHIIKHRTKVKFFSLFNIAMGLAFFATLLLNMQIDITILILYAIISTILALVLLFEGKIKKRRRR